MSRTEMHVDAQPEDVFAVLADPDSYGDWVVGSKEIRGADDGFPASGTRFYHRVGFGPIDISDNTEVVESQPPHRLVLHAKARPMGVARVELAMVPQDGGTLVEMREEPISPVSRLMHNPLADFLLHGRNVEALRRLKRLAEQHAGRRA